jgi:hypothetical protein
MSGMLVGGPVGGTGRTVSLGNGGSRIVNGATGDLVGVSVGPSGDDGSGVV